MPWLHLATNPWGHFHILLEITLSGIFPLALISFLYGFPEIPVQHHSGFQSKATFILQNLNFKCIFLQSLGLLKLNNYIVVSSQYLLQKVRIAFSGGRCTILWWSMYHPLFEQYIGPSKCLMQRFSVIAWAPKSLGGGGKVRCSVLLKTSSDSNTQQELRITAKYPLPLRQESFITFMSFPWFGIFLLITLACQHWGILFGTFLMVYVQVYEVFC